MPGDWNTMPVYTYRCQKCGAEFEKTQQFNDRPLTRCPECRKGRVHRLVQPLAFILTGPGWYSTDHRTPTGQGSSRQAESNPDKSESTPSKADSQPAGKEQKPDKADGVREPTEERPRARGAYRRVPRYNQTKRPTA
jgi:putative FmdB family regulatory protein